MTQPTTSVSSASVPSPALSSTPSDANDQWSLVWKNFRKHRLAVGGVLLICTLITISVFAPFLANGMPLWYRGYNRFQYQDASRTLSYLVTRWGSEKPGTPPAPAADAKDSAKDQPAVPLNIPATMRLQTSIMRESLATDLGEELSRKVETLIDTPLESRAPVVADLKKELRDKFDPRKIQFVSRTLFPVVSSLHWSELFCMTATILLVLSPLWSRWLPKSQSITGKSRKNQVRLLVFVGLPALVAGLWWYAVPERLDRTPYHRGVLSSADPAALQSAPVVYDSVVRAPIPYDLDANDLNRKHSPPSRDHLLGTDEVGRDVMSRMIWGGRVSLSVGIISVSINILIGVIVGALAGYYRGTWDLIISRIIEVVICFPSFFLILTIVAFIGPSIFNIMIVLGLIGWTGVAQLVRGEFLRLGEQEFILAARALGFSSARIIFLHVLPNAMAPVLVSATFGVAGAILTESGLSFLGLGITVPKPSWGGILASGREAIRLAPWLIYFPGLVIFITITAYNLVGETLRDAADPRMRSTR